MTQLPKYTMDDATFKHLTEWCNNQFHDDERDVVRERIMGMLSTMEVEDAEYSISHGWWHVYDLTGYGQDRINL